jgi:hypothetical protein
LKIQKQYDRENDRKRNKRTIIFLWENWQVFFKEELGIRKEDRSSFFNVNEKYISDLRQEYENEWDNYYIKIVPLKILPIPKGDINERLLTESLNKIYALDEETQDLLGKYSCKTPFLNRTLSNIITKELYENSMEHAYIGEKQEKTNHPACYMSVSLLKKIREYTALDTIQRIKDGEFKDEAIPESTHFYFRDGEYENQSYIQFTFMDFGNGIPYSLNINEDIKKKLNGKTDSEIIMYAFDSSISRHPIDERFANRIRRGLYDVMDIVKRYKGLIIIRSQGGKVLYDFSLDKKISNCARIFNLQSKKPQLFNGTIITLLIPEAEKIKMDKITHELSQGMRQQFEETTKKELHYISILKIITVQTFFFEKIKVL